MDDHDDTSESLPANELGSIDTDALFADTPVVAESLRAYGAERGDIRLAHTDTHARLDARQPIGRIAREELEDAMLAPGATRAVGAGNRQVREDPDPWRTCFERDVDKVRYAPAFRRLAHKCQVFIAPDDDHLRTRLTHAIEVAQFAGAVARRIGLNPALCEAASLFHDCGHGPAGHASEEAFAEFLPGGFDHATWGAHQIAAPMNLCDEVIDAIACHSWRLKAPSTPEGELLSWSDRCCYLAHDFDDAVRAGIVTYGDLPVEVAEVLGRSQAEQIGSMIDAICATATTTGWLGMDPTTASAIDAFRKFNYERIYLRPASRTQAERVIALLRALVEYFIDAPGKIPDVAAGSVEFPRSGSPESALEAVRYVASMTDRYAISMAVDVLGWRSEALPRSA
jgi:dGTPase